MKRRTLEMKICTTENISLCYCIPWRILWQSLQSARVGSARVGSARVGPARVGSARVGSARVGSARVGSARVWPARVWPARVGSARVGSARVGPARVGSGRARHTSGTAMTGSVCALLFLLSISSADSRWKCSLYLQPPHNHGSRN